VLERDERPGTGRTDPTVCRDVEQLARAGIVARHPTYSEIEICHELARRRYGAAFADAAYAGLLPGG